MLGVASLKFILISPLVSGAGASTIAANLSYCLSKKDERVLLVSAERSFSETDALFGLPSGRVPGWRSSDTPLEDLTWKISPTLHYLPAGRSDISSPVGQKKFRSENELIQSLNDETGIEWLVLDGFNRDSLIRATGQNSGIALHVVEANSSGMQALSEFRNSGDWSIPGTYCLVNKHHQRSRLEQDLVKLFRNFLQEKFCPVVFGFDEIALRAALRKEVLCQNFAFTDLGEKFFDLSTWVKLRFVSANPERVAQT